jgi:hypothetical protein
MTVESADEGRPFRADPLVHATAHRHFDGLWGLPMAAPTRAGSVIPAMIAHDIADR